MRREVQQLVEWASNATDSGSSSLGPLRGVVEVAAGGRSRLIRIADESDKELHWSVRTLFATEKPSFYPENLPFVPGCIALLSRGGGIWTVPAVEGRRQDIIPESVLGRLPPRLLIAVHAVSSSSPIHAKEVLEQILSYHRRSGWALEPRPAERRPTYVASGPLGARRIVTTSTEGVTTISLSYL